MATKIISADSHITEPPDTYTARIDPAFRERAPHLVRDDKLGDIYVIPGIKSPVPMGLVAAAGKTAELMKTIELFHTKVLPRVTR